MSTEEPAPQPDGADEAPPFADHNVMATYETVEGARSAIRALERAGVEAGDISLLGPGMEPDEQPETNEEQYETDMEVTHDIGKRAAAGGAAGTAAGALLGGALGAAAFAVPGIGTVVGAGLIGGAVSGAVAGGALGAFYGGATGLPVSEAWGATYDSVKGGHTLVAVHSDDPAAIDRAVSALRHVPNVRMAVFGRDGRLVDVH